MERLAKTANRNFNEIKSSNDFGSKYVAAVTQTVI